jgi:hypothetical protein
MGDKYRINLVRPYSQFFHLVEYHITSAGTGIHQDIPAAFLDEKSVSRMFETGRGDITPQYGFIRAGDYTGVPVTLGLNQSVNLKLSNLTRENPVNFRGKTSGNYRAH